VNGSQRRVAVPLMLVARSCTRCINRTIGERGFSVLFWDHGRLPRAPGLHLITARASPRACARSASCTTLSPPGCRASCAGVRGDARRVHRNPSGPERGRQRVDGSDQAGSGTAPDTTSSSVMREKRTTRRRSGHDVDPGAWVPTIRQALTERAGRTSRRLRRPGGGRRRGSKQPGCRGCRAAR
jgi:hypothetical protein